MRIGIVAVQGGVSVHREALGRHGHEAFAVRRVADLEGAEGLVMPGGESTAQWRLLELAGLTASLDRRVKDGMPLLATCAGLILGAAEVEGNSPRGFRWFDLRVARNAWGRQVDSFETRGDRQGRRLVFIRAPRILRVGTGIEVLETFRGEPVLVRQGRRVGATFHPELSRDPWVISMTFGDGRAAARLRVS